MAQPFNDFQAVALHRFFVDAIKRARAARSAIIRYNNAIVIEAENIRRGSLKSETQNVIEIMSANASRSEGVVTLTGISAGTLYPNMQIAVHDAEGVDTFRGYFTVETVNDETITYRQPVGNNAANTVSVGAWDIAGALTAAATALALKPLNTSDAASGTYDDQNVFPDIHKPEIVKIIYNQTLWSVETGGTEDHTNFRKWLFSPSNPMMRTFAEEMQHRIGSPGGEYRHDLSGGVYRQVYGGTFRGNSITQVDMAKQSFGPGVNFYFSRWINQFRQDDKWLIYDLVFNLYQTLRRIGYNKRYADLAFTLASNLPEVTSQLQSELVTSAAEVFIAVHNTMTFDPAIFTAAAVHNRNYTIKTITSTGCWHTPHPKVAEMLMVMNTVDTTRFDAVDWINDVTAPSNMYTGQLVETVPEHATCVQCMDESGHITQN